MGPKIQTSSLQKTLPMRWDYMRGDDSDRLHEYSPDSFEEDDLSRMAQTVHRCGRRIGLLTIGAYSQDYHLVNRLMAK